MRLIQLLEKFWVSLEQVGYFQLNFIKSKYRSKNYCEYRCGLEVKYTPDFQDLVGTITAKKCKISHQASFILITHWNDNILDSVKYFF